ncbi:cell division protein FtsY [Azospirillum sp. TSO35-2]|nr:cell division protein FtsY [Azospirillum sp. TSO35-2]
MAPIPEPVPVPVPAPAPVAAVPADEAPPSKKGWFAKLKEGLSKSSSKLTDGITGIFTKRKLDDEALEELEELLITADLGPATAAKVTAELARTRFGKEVSPEEVKVTLAAEVAKIVGPVAKPLELDPALAPHVILVVGVNGTGKTTTIGKLARQFKAEGKSVMLAAGDTFRAAAVSQLKIWGERTGCPVVARDTGADAAGLAYDALERARAEKVDVLLIDTAGRLQNKTGLMEELRKIVRVIKKLDETAPHTTLLTLDATTGQNAHSQVEIFRDMVNVNGLILTKLDGSARGGVLVSLAEKFRIPVHAIGVGEGIYDLRPFDADAFAKSLMGLNAD